jgi:hypothetical protein
MLLQLPDVFCNVLICSKQLFHVSGSTSHRMSPQFTWNPKVTNQKSDSRTSQCFTQTYCKVESPDCQVHRTQWHLCQIISLSILCQIVCERLYKTCLQRPEISVPENISTCDNNCSYVRQFWVGQKVRSVHRWSIMGTKWERVKCM